MNVTNAIKIVLRAAEANANGHEKCAEILRAIEIVKQLLKITVK